MTENILYIEAANGISGDMLLGAFLDLGVPVEVLHDAWDALGIDNYEIEISETMKAGMRALRCRVRTEESSGPRTWKQYQQILKRSSLQPGIRDAALTLCRRLFEIEADFHGSTLTKLHLHEVGGTDLLIDVVGSLAAVEYLKPSCIAASAVNTGHGFIRFSHGVFPVPAPATTRLLQGIPVFQNEVDGELATPTGVLLLSHLAKQYGPMPPMTLLKSGAGAGEREIADHPNVVRLFWGTSESHETTSREDICMAETNIDDSNPQLLAYFMEKAFERGALDVFFTPIFMKKNRPAVRLTILAARSALEDLLALLFAETTAIGTRYWKVERSTLERRWKEVRIGRHAVRIKESLRDGRILNYQPEYEDCRAVAEKTKTPLKEVIAQVLHHYLSSR